MDTLIIAVSGLFGLLNLGLVVTRPKAFWKLLILSSFGLAGIMVEGHCILDEYIAACLVIGLILAFFVGGLKRKTTSSFELHKWSYYLLIVFMLSQSMRGLVLWSDPALVRWMAYYLILFLICFFSYNYELSDLSPFKASQLIVLASFLYLVSYTIYTFYNMLYRGILYNEMQGTEWSGSAYATYAPGIALPAVALLLKSGVKSSRTSLLVWLYMTILVFTAFFHDSRVLYLMIIGFLVVSWRAINLKRIFLMSVIFFVGLIFVYNQSLVKDSSNSLDQKIGDFSEAIKDVSEALWNPTDSDVGRQAHIVAGFQAISESPLAFFIGYGVHSSRYIIGPYIDRYVSAHTGREHGYDSASETRTTGLPALLVETGVVGVFLHVLNFVFASLTLMRRSSSRAETVILLFALWCGFLWTMISNIQDIILFYLIAMPNGIFTYIVQGETQNAQEIVSEAAPVLGTVL